MFETQIKIRFNGGCNRVANNILYKVHISFLFTVVPLYRLYIYQSSNGRNGCQGQEESSSYLYTTKITTEDLVKRNYLFSMVVICLFLFLLHQFSGT